MPDPVAVSSMFARIARNYDRANRLLSAGTDLWWRRCLVGQVRRHSPSRVLDLATGSGDVAFALARVLPRDTTIIGMDFCQPMLDEAEAKKKAAPRREGTEVEFLPGDGLALPLADGGFDAVTISFGLRNMTDRACSLREMRRVLRPGGRLFVLEFSQPQQWFKPLYFFYLRHILPAIAGAVTGDRAAYVYLNETIEQFPAAQELSGEIERAGFVQVQFKRLSLGMVALHEARA
jgi:demethylmenaquinone methyltransferase/2-methoxy-6-polyprenyl-1,4-benzoquinol methylase